MGDSDEEYDRRRGRDKFRRERNDYDRRDDRRGGREQWDDRGGEAWGGRDRGRREYRDYGDRRRDRYSPQRQDSSPPHFKRMRRDWDDNFHNDSGFGGGGGPMYSGPPNTGGTWNQGGGGGAQGQDGPKSREDFPPTQPAMMTFKLFLATQDDHISDEEAIKKFNEYKMDFKKIQIQEFFSAHKEQEWFKSKYHPEDCDRRKEDIRATLKRRRDIFLKLMEMGRVGDCCCDVEKYVPLVKLLDAAVILMEGGKEEDLKCLDIKEPSPIPENTRGRTESETQPADKSMEEGESEDNKRPAEDGEMREEEEDRPRKVKKKKPVEEDPDAEEGACEDSPKSDKRRRTKNGSYYESGSDSDSGSLSDSDEEPRDEPGPPGVEDSNPPQLDGTGDDPPPEAAEAEEVPETKDKEGGTDTAEQAEEEEKEKDATQEEDGEEMEPPKYKPLHKTQSIFLRNLAPTITKQEVEAMCKRYPGFLRVALQDPQPERNFYRRGWVTFDSTVNIKEICWNLNNIRLRDCEMGAIVNRELKQRVRPINGQVAHRFIAKNDIKHAAKIIQNLDARCNMWDETEEEKQDQEKQSFGLVSKNPVLKNITDYLVEEGSYEEEALLGQAVVEDLPRGRENDLVIERDEELLKVLDRMILYLRIVHSYDYYSGAEYPNEDEMPHRCGIMHARATPPPTRITQNDLNDWVAHFEMKITPMLNLKIHLGEEEAIKLGKKDLELEVEKFITANTQELAKDKWLCPLSGKKFKGPEFVRKHIHNKHTEKVDEVKAEVAYFNNYLLDPKRPQLPDHPANRLGGSSGASRGDQSGPPGGYQGPQNHNMMGGGSYRSRPPMMHYGNRRGNRRGGYHGYQNYHSRGGGQDRFRNDNRDRYQPQRRDRMRHDPRGIIEYRDLDVPDDTDIF